MFRDPSSVLHGWAMSPRMQMTRTEAIVQTPVTTANIRAGLTYGPDCEIYEIKNAEATLQRPNERM